MEQTERVIMTLKRAEWSEMTMAIHPNVHRNSWRPRPLVIPQAWLPSGRTQ